MNQTYETRIQENDLSAAEPVQPGGMDQSAASDGDPADEPFGLAGLVITPPSECGSSGHFADIEGHQAHEMAHAGGGL